MKTLQIIKTAYRATIEEQDDTVVWITRAMRGAGAELDVLLTSDAVSYAVQAQDASGLAFGSWRQTQPPRIAADIAALLEKGVGVYYVAEHANDRGLDDVPLIKDAQPLRRAELPTLLGRYDRVWQW
jgi:sulfur relay (sulfurtransferase) DsrF/TusC family protein